MIQFRKTLLYSLFLIIVLSVAISFAWAVSTSFTVHGGEDVTRALDLAVEDHVTIKFSSIGNADSTINFYIVCPNETVKQFGKISQITYGFICDVAGEYVLHFSNVDSVEDKLVTLDYEVQHYIFGIPQMLFLTLIIVAVCMVAVAVFILMGKPH